MDDCIEELKELFTNEFARTLFVKKIINKRYTIKGNFFNTSTGISSHCDVLFAPKTHIKDGCLKINLKMPLDYERNDIVVRSTFIFLRYSHYTNTQLKQFCKQNKIKGYSKMKKLELIRALMSI